MEVGLLWSIFLKYYIIMSTREISDDGNLNIDRENIIDSKEIESYR